MELFVENENEIVCIYLNESTEKRAKMMCKKTVIACEFSVFQDIRDDYGAAT